MKSHRNQPFQGDSGIPPGHLDGGLVAIFYFPINIGLLIIPIDELIFFRGVAQPPTSHLWKPPISWEKQGVLAILFISVLLLALGRCVRRRRQRRAASAKAQGVFVGRFGKWKIAIVDRLKR